MTDIVCDDLDTSAHVLFFRHSPVKRQGICYGQSRQETRHDASEVAELFISALQHREHPQRVQLSESVATLRTIVWSSPAPRCMEAAQLIAERLNVRHEVDSRLYEISFGDWEGRSWAELERDQPSALNEWMNHWKTHSPPHGETLEIFQRRVFEWQRELSPDLHHILIGHAGVLRAMLVNSAHQAWDEAMSLSVPHLTLRSVHEFAELNDEH